MHALLLAVWIVRAAFLLRAAVWWSSEDAEREE
jgi:hypothetical protein